MTDQSAASADIRAGMSGTDRRDDQGEARRARRIAHDFKRDEMYDRLLAWRDSDSRHWDDLDRSTQLRASMYENQRSIAAEYGTDNQPPAA